MTADCVKLTSYFGERHPSGGSFTADALIELYGRHEIAASILLRGTEGFGLKHHLRTDRSLTLSEDLPLIAVAVDTRSRIEAVLPQAVQLNQTGLVTLERARLLTDVTAAGWSPGDLPEAAKLTIYLGRQERAGRVPAFIAVCDLLHRRGLDGATALLGVDGTAHGRRERAAFFSRNAEVPMMVIAFGSGERIGAVLPELGPLLRRPLATVERVRVCKRDGRRLAAPPVLPGADDHGMTLWHKLTVYTSETLKEEVVLPPVTGEDSTPERLPGALLTGKLSQPAAERTGFEPAASSSRSQVHRSSCRAYLPAGLLGVSVNVRRRPRKDRATVTQLVTRPGLLRLRTPPFA